MVLVYKVQNNEVYFLKIIMIIHFKDITQGCSNPDGGGSNFLLLFVYNSFVFQSIDLSAQIQIHN